MKNIKHLLVTLLVMCFALQSEATAYEASKVSLSTSGVSASMTLLGKTQDGCQIWACQNSYTSGATGAAWSIDGGSSISAEVSEFLPNTKYTLAASDDNFQNYPRTLSSNTGYVHFLKISSQDKADFFTWNAADMPDFASDFQLGGSVSASVIEKYYGDGDAVLINKVQYSLSGINEAAFDHATLELSYDKGATWQTVNANIVPDFSQKSAILPIMVSIDHDSVCYRFTAYPKNIYKAVVNLQAWTCVTPNYVINGTMAAPIHPTSVTMTVMDGASEEVTDHISMGKLGLTADGYDVWACTTGRAYYTYWQIDGGNKMCGNKVYHFQSNTIYSINSDDYKATIAENYLHSDVQKSDVHFIKPTGAEMAEYCSWNHDASFHLTSFYIKGTPSIGSKAAFTLDKTNGCLTHPFSWNIKGPCQRMVGKVVVETTLDGGNTWETVFTKEFTSSDADDYTTTTGMGTATVKSEGETLRYRLTVYPKDNYSVLAENGYWRAESQDIPITVADAPTCTIQASALTLDTAKKGYTTNVTWDAFSTASDIYGGATIQYSTDKGQTWATAATVTAASGCQSITLPVGYSQYLLRVAAYPTETLAKFSVLNPIAVSDPLTAEYTPAVTSFAAEQQTGSLEYGQFGKVTLSYALNDCLLLNHGKAYISYSYDNGNTWQQLKGFIPKATGTQNVMVDTACKQCKFRIRVNTMVDGVNTPIIAETENISLN